MHSHIYNWKNDDFQRWISRLVYRWRTLRTAILNANCTTQWIIETLNAHCAAVVIPQHAWSSVVSKPYSLKQRFVSIYNKCILSGCLFLSCAFLERESVRLRVNAVFLHSHRLFKAKWHSIGGLRKTRIQTIRDVLQSLFLHVGTRLMGYNGPIIVLSRIGVFLFASSSFVAWKHLSHKENIFSFGQTSAQARLPAEFKHIIKRRKRN